MYEQQSRSSFISLREGRTCLPGEANIIPQVKRKEVEKEGKEGNE
jgi:hypothetical protein